ncbi:hypothetical protein KEM55_000480, partial [Ascosphaera atra]
LHEIAVLGLELADPLLRDFAHLLRDLAGLLLVVQLSSERLHALAQIVLRDERHGETARHVRLALGLQRLEVLLLIRVPGGTAIPIPHGRSRRPRRRTSHRRTRPTTSSPT